MIDAEYIKEWRPEHPWMTAAMVEQDLLISRALVAIFSDPFLSEHLAFRGGTALHKLYMHPQPRYSEDIDLVQIHPGPINEIMNHLREALAYMPEPYAKTSKINNTLIYKYTSEIAPVERMRLKVEINCREHFHVLPWVKIPFSVHNGWFSGNCEIVTYKLDELLGTKLRALYQRRKGRDLFDLDYALTQAEVHEEKILPCFCKYIHFVDDKIPTQRQFEMNMKEKLASDEYINDTRPILIPSVTHHAPSAYAHVHGRLISHIDTYRDAYLRS
ncbi:MAG: nucleotidyl transferase AbiEii/AbiGii toxin family protein [Akkermansiaceae bacterium]|nr:nucleotidyl transferase AbiEii/AbiGii toxin family protein [Akkermansiaceae bacterium]